MKHFTLIHRLLVLITVFFCSLSSIAKQFESIAIKPIPIHQNHNENQVALGKSLFQDKRLSDSKKLACSTCHDPKNGGTLNTPNFPTSNPKSKLNIPTLLNAQYNFRYFWDGRAKTLKDAIEQSIISPKEMSRSWTQLIARLNEDPNYPDTFKEIFNDTINKENIIEAIETYIKSLNTPNSRFDLFLSGHTEILSKDEQQGYKLFESYGCISCHQGINIGGNMMQKFGIYKNYVENKSNIDPTDYGLYNVTKLEEDKFTFKVPSLRNIALTSPYLHDGSAKDLKAAINAMAIYQVGRSIPDTDIELIVKFLQTLTGEINQQ